MPRFVHRLSALAVLLAPLMSFAQVTTPPTDFQNYQLAPGTPTPEPAATPLPIPSPTSIPTPAPTTSPTPRPLPMPRPTATPSPTSTPTASPAPVATPRANPSPVATPSASPSPVSTPSPLPTPTRAPIETVVLPRQESGIPLWAWLAGGALLLLGLALLFGRRRGDPDVDVFDPGASAQPAPLPPAPAAAPLPTARARLAITLDPTRAGLNLLTATVESEVTMTNTGDATARDIRAAVGLDSAHAGTDADLASLAAQPVARPAVPPFTLAPGEARRFRAVAALPHELIRSLDVGGRPMFVPLVVVGARWRDGSGERSTTQGFVVGITRAGAPKLAPLWLDVPPRTYDAVAARPHASPLEG